MKKPSNDFITSIKKGICGTFTFSGKSNQFEFTTYIVLTAIVFYGSKVLLFPAIDLPESIAGPLVFVWFALMILVSISQFANGARRLEDIGKNKWLLLIGFIPIIGVIFILYLCVTPSVTKKRKRKRK